MAATDKEIVDLVIEAKNLTSDELNQAADDVTALGRAAGETQEKLSKLKIKQDTIASYTQVRGELNKLRDELRKAELDYEDLNKAVKQNKEATREERDAVKKSKDALDDLRATVRSQKTEYNKLSKAVKAYDKDTEAVVSSQETLSQEIAQLESKLTRQNRSYREQSVVLREKVTAEKESIAASKEAAAIAAKLTAEQEKAAFAAKAAADKQRVVEDELHRVSVATSEYEAELKKLNNSRLSGNVTTEKYIRREAELREQFKLTKQQVEVSRKAVEAAAATEARTAKEISQAIKEQRLAQEKLNIEKKKAVEARIASAQATQKEQAEAVRVTAAIKQYEKALEELNAEKKKGTVASGDYIKREEALRRQYKLSEKQVKTTRQAIEADVATRKKAGKSTDALTAATRRLAQAYTVLLAAQKATQAVGAGVKQYGDLEEAMVKVEKTTGLARSEIVAMTDKLRTMAEDVTPTSTQGLLKYAEVAGQLGVKSTEDLLNVASAADALQVSTNLAGDEAALLLSRILAMTGDGIGGIHNLSSAVVALGNDFEVAEDELVHMTKEVVTGTRSLNLSAAASAGFGATLKALGQRAESSRTAMQKLTTSIKSAALEGGDDLKTLSDITGLTADEIEKNLADRPEEVIVRFLEGMNKIANSGGTVADTLKRVGIDGTEAAGVLGILAGGTGKLRKAINLSNKEWESQLAHLTEANKAYASQNSSLARLANRFATLKEKIGETFSDEVYDSVNGLNTSLDKVEDTVISLMDYISEMGDGVIEILEPVDDFMSEFTGGIGVIDGLMGSLKASINLVTIAVRGLVLNVQNLKLYWAEFRGAGESELKRLRDDIKETTEAIKEDFKDMQLAAMRMRGESSIAYEGLLENIAKYGQAVTRLSTEEQAAINEIINKTGYIETENDTYRELTAEIIYHQRQLDAEAKAKKQAAENSKKNAEAKKEETKATKELTKANDELVESVDENRKATSKKIETLDDAVNSASNYEEAIANLSRLYRDEKITAEQYANSVELVGSIQDRVAGNTDDLAASTSNYIQKAEELRLQHEKGILTDAEYATSQENLTAAFESTSGTVTTIGESTEYLTRAQTELNEEIASSEVRITELNRSLKNLTKGSEKHTQVTAQLSDEQERLNELKQKATALAEIEGRTYTELMTLQTQYEIELRKVQAAFEAGTITAGEYQEKQTQLQSVLNKVNSLIGDNTSEHDRNTEAVKRNTSATREYITVKDELTEAIDREYGARRRASEELRQGSQGYTQMATGVNALSASHNYESESLERLRELYREQRDIYADVSHARRHSASGSGELAVKMAQEKLRTIESALAAKEREVALERANRATKEAVEVNSEFERSLAASNQRQRERIDTADEWIRKLESGTITMEEWGEAQRFQMTQAKALSAELRSNLNQALNESYKELKAVENATEKVTEATDDYDGAIRNNGYTVSRWVEKLNSGTASLADINNAALFADSSISQLGENTLDPLIRAIEQARGELQRLQDDSLSLIESAQDRLDRAMGREQEIDRRRYEREIAAYEEQIKALYDAKEYALVNQTRQAMRQLEEAQKLEFKGKYGTTGTGRTTAVQQPTEQVTLNLNIGGKTFTTTTDRDTAAELKESIDRLKRLGG